VSVLREVFRRRPIAVAVGLAALLTSPLLFSGFMLDDVWHLGSLEGVVLPQRGPLGLSRFADGGPEEVRAAVARGGFFPWWAAEDTRVAFFRPVGSALTAFDHALFGHNATGYHAHLILWFLAFVGETSSEISASTCG
jgi:hypothetical protein